MVIPGKREFMKQGIGNGLSCVICLGAVLALAGCEKKSDTAVVILKEHIPARESGYTPPKKKKSASPVRSRANEEEKATEQEPGTITVDGYIMKPEEQGTGRDPRALNHEQWIVTVRSTNTGQTFRIQTGRSQFEKVHPPDLVQVVYRVGKYTGTVWDAEIVERK